MLVRAIRRVVFASALLLVCTLAGCKHSQQERALSFPEIMRADVSPAQRGQHVSDIATITYIDPEWHLLFAQDSTGSVYIEPPSRTDLKAGDSVRITGTTTLPAKLLADTQFTVLHSGALPPPLKLAQASDLASHPSAFVQLKGTVRWSGIRYGRATLELSDGNQRFTALIFPASSDDLPRIASEIIISGVSACEYDKAGRVAGLQLLTPSSREIQVLRTGPSDPFSLQNTKLSALNNVSAGALVHLSGKIVDRPEGMFIEETGQPIRLNLHEVLRGAFDRADVAGFWNGQSIEDAVIRPTGALSIHAGDITRLSELKMMTVAEAALRRHLNVQAVVTYWDPAWRILFVQDNTGGAFVFTRGPDPSLRVGDVLDIAGVSGPGDYAPVILDPTIRFLRHGALPAPLPVDIDEDNLDAEDSRWCSLLGIVHSAQVRDGHTSLLINVGQTALNVQFPTMIDTGGLIDKEISVEGVIAIFFNERRQAVGRQIFVPSAAFMKVHAKRINPVTSIASLRRYSPAFDDHHAATLTGTVVLKSSEHTIFLQDQGAGIEVRTLAPVHVSVGDRISVRGFILTGEYSPVLQDAVVENRSPGEVPQPQQVSARSAAEGPHDSQFVSIRAKLATVHSTPTGVVLVLNDSGTYFEASGPLGDYPLALRSGSMVEVKGVCQVLLNRATVPFAVRGFTLLFDSPHSVTVLRPGPWWDSTRISWALWGIGLFAIVAALWATLLRRQVHAKTRELQSSLAAKRKAREFDQARNEVLEGIAGNSPLPESMERLALAIEGQIPECVCALVMPPDGRSFLNGKPSPVLIAPGLGEDSQHELLGPLSRMLDGSAGLDQVTTSGNCDSSTPLLEPLHAAGLNFSRTLTTIVFSASGSAAGLIILLLKPSAPDPGEPAPQAILQSSARLLALARDHSRMHEQLVHEARHDGLTGLPNRMVAEDRLEQAIARAVRARKVFAVICIDLDGFKAVNDEFGHDSGDELLRTASARLRSRVRHADTLARMGGDEFLAIVEDCAGDSGAQSVAQSLIAVLQEPIVLEGRTVQISGSIGVAMYPRDGKNASQLKRSADQAMYQAKGRGGSQVSFFSGNAHGLAQASEATSAGNR